MAITTRRARRGRFSPNYRWGRFLQFVRDITRDFTRTPAMAAAGSELYNYLEGDGKLRYLVVFREKIERILGVKRAHAASITARIRAVAGMTTDGPSKQLLEQIANELSACGKELWVVAHTAEMNERRSAVLGLAEYLGGEHGKA